MIRILPCSYCGGTPRLANSKEVHGIDSNNFFYVCSNYPACDSFVSCHSGTVTPMGTVANYKLRQLRRQVHAKMDPIWKSGVMTRSQVYQWLQDTLGLSPDAAHVGMLDEEQCKTILSVCHTWITPPQKLRYRHKVNKEDRLNLRRRAAKAKGRHREFLLRTS